MAGAQDRKARLERVGPLNPLRESPYLAINPRFTHYAYKVEI